MDCSLPGSSVHGILQARLLEWVANSFSRGWSLLRDQTRVSCIGRWVLHHWASRVALRVSVLVIKRKVKVSEWNINNQDQIESDSDLLNKRKIQSFIFHFTYKLDFRLAKE